MVGGELEWSLCTDTGIWLDDEGMLLADQEQILVLQWAQDSRK